MGARPESAKAVKAQRTGFIGRAPSGHGMTGTLIEQPVGVTRKRRDEWPLRRPTLQAAFQGGCGVASFGQQHDGRLRAVAGPEFA